MDQNLPVNRHRAKFKKCGPTLIGLVLLAFVNLAFAASGSDELGDGMCSLTSVLTGKWLFGITMLSMLGGGTTLMFGAEISEAMKKLVGILTIFGLILSFAGLIRTIFPSVMGC